MIVSTPPDIGLMKFVQHMYRWSCTRKSIPVPFPDVKGGDKVTINIQSSFVLSNILYVNFPIKASSTVLRHR